MTNLSERHEHWYSACSDCNELYCATCGLSRPSYLEPAQFTVTLWTHDRHEAVLQAWEAK